jgi:DNA-binding beta-propeller fold protein YncE
MSSKLKGAPRRLDAGAGHLLSCPRWISHALSHALGLLACATLLLLVLASPASALPASFASEGSGAGQISTNPQGIAIDQESGDVYVSDRENNRIEKFDGEGKFLLAFGWGVADGESEELQTCTTLCFEGLRGEGAGEFSGNEGIAINNDPSSLSHGDVYVIDANNLRVQKFDPEGKFLTMFGGEVNSSTSGDICPASEAAFCKAGVEGGAPGSFQALNGRSIAVDSSSATVYVGDFNRVQRFSEEGVIEGEVSLPGVESIQNLALDSAKDIYLHASAQEGVHKYDSTGKELPPPRDEAGFGQSLAIAIGPGDELFLNDFRELSATGNHILTFNPAGEQTASFDAGDPAKNGERGIAYNTVTKAIYVLNGGAVRIVTPPPPGPFVLLASESVSEVQPTSATLCASINPEGPEATKYHFEYGKSSAYTNSTPEAELSGSSFEDQEVCANITGLEPGSTYHFRVVAENAAKETAQGPDQSFSTLPAVSIDATSASQVTATSARLEAQLNPHGLASEYHFEYDTSPYLEGQGPHGITIPVPDGEVGEASVDTTVANTIQELIPQSTYHYRVIAHNALGTVIGPDRSFTTQGPGSILPDGRSWEQVSPANKHGSPLEPLRENGALIQAAAGGGAFAYVALGPVESEPQGSRSPADSQLLAAREAKGWQTQDITTPHEELSEIHVGFPSEYTFFAEDLSAGAVEPEGATPLSPQTSERTPYRRETSSGEFVPLVTASNVPAGTKFGGEEFKAGSWFHGVEFRAASADLAHVVLTSPQILAAGFKAGFEAGGMGNLNLYELSNGKLALVSVLPNGEAAAEAGLIAVVGQAGENMRGAISSDGGRVVFETVGGGRHLYVRDVAAGQSVQLDVRQPGAGGGPGDATFQAASADGKRVFFSDPSKLTADASAKPGQPDLYMCEVALKVGVLGCALSDLSVDPNPGEAADVQGEVSAIDGAGGHVYFAANGVLTSEANARGEVAKPGECKSEGEADCNLYEYDVAAHHLSLVAVLSSHDDPDWAGRTSVIRLGNLTARSSPDGHYFTFMSRRSLSGYDNRDAKSGEADEEVFLFDSSSGKLSCVSCNPDGARPAGVFDPSRETLPGLVVDYARSWQERWLAASIPGWTTQSLGTALYQSRYLSDSGRMFFNATDALVPEDKNEVSDVYQFEPPGVGDCTSSSATYSTASGGCVNLISSGSSKQESAFLDASQGGDEVFFLTAARLAKSDVDGAMDVYDAHVCSSSSPCPPPPPPTTSCEGDSCQNPSSPPGEQTPSSLTYKGPENPPALAPAKAKAPSKAQLLAKALKACKKKKAKHKRVLCERQARKKYGAKSKAAHKRAKAHHTQSKGAAR